MHNLKTIYTKKGDISLFTVMVLSMVMMALLFNISIKTNRDLTTSRDANLSQQAYNKAIKGADAWIECASNPTVNPTPAELSNCNSVAEAQACGEESNNGVISECETPTYVEGASPSITVKATSRNTSTGKTVNRVIKVEFSN